MKLVVQFLSLALSVLLITGPVNAQSGDTLQVIASEDPTGTGWTVQVNDVGGAPVSDAAVVFRLPDEGPSGTFDDGTRAAVVYTDAAGHLTLGTIKWNLQAGICPVRISATRGAVHGVTTVNHVIGGAAMPPAPVRVAVAEAPQPERLSQEAVPPPQPGTPEPKHSAAPEAPVAPVPRVTVTAPPTNERIHSGGGGKKWLLLIALAAGAGAGAAFAAKGKAGSSSTTGTTSTGITIGTPTVSVGHP